MVGSVDTGSSSTKSNSKAVQQLTDTLAKGVQSAYQPGGSSYVAPSQTTQNSWAQMLGTANNQGYASDLAATLGAYGNRASGAEIGMDAPGYAQMRSDLSDNVLTTIDSRYNDSGMLGSDRNVRDASSGLASALGGLDYQQYNDSLSRQAEAAGMLPGLYNSSLTPSSITGAVGAAQDADAQAKASGGTDYLGQFLSLLNGASGAAGTTTTQSMPWWKVGLGAASTAASFI